MEKKERKIAIRYDKADPAKVIISENLYKEIENNLLKIKDDEISEDYAYSSYVFGNYEGLFDTCFDKSEELELKRKENLYIITDKDYNIIENHMYSGNYCLANFIYHTSNKSTDEDNYKDYINYFNFYNGRIRIFSVIVTENENSKPKIAFFEQIKNHNEVYIRDKVFIRVNDKDIPMEEYQNKKQDENTTSHGTK